MSRREPPRSTVGVLAVLAACSGTSVRGAVVEAPEGDSSGAQLARFAVGQCLDRSGSRMDARPGSEVVVRSGVARPVVVEKRPGFDSLVITNGFQDGERFVAQTVVDTAGGKIVRQISIPRAALGGASAAVPAAGRLDVARDWTETDLGGGRFRAALGRSVISCVLAPVLAAASPPSAQSPDAGAPAPSASDAGPGDRAQPSSSVTTN